MRIATLALVVAACLTSPALAEIKLTDAYARAASPMAKTGAAYLRIENTSDTPDRLLSVTSPAAKRIELHTHLDAGDGVMQMRQIDGGIPLPAQSSHSLRRGAGHVMMMGLTRRFLHGEKITLTFTFEQAGDITQTIPIDLERQETHDTHDMN